VAQRLRLCYAKRGRLRFTSHRDFQRAFERALRRAAVPMAYSAGFSPHPKVSYAGAAPTGVASEAEYLEIALTDVVDPARLRDRLDGCLPPGLDVLEIVEARTSGLVERLEASIWEITLPGLDHLRVTAAIDQFMAAEQVPVQRLTKTGVRSFDARHAVVKMQAKQCGADRNWTPCAILRVVVRHGTPAVRPDDVLSGLRHVAELAPPAPAQVRRLAQGPLDAQAGTVSDPLSPDREASSAADENAKQAAVSDAGGGTAVGVSARP
jgi:radical SAM-linked protein